MRPPRPVMNPKSRLGGPGEQRGGTRGRPVKQPFTGFAEDAGVFWCSCTVPRRGQTLQFRPGTVMKRDWRYVECAVSVWFNWSLWLQAAVAECCRFKVRVFFLSDRYTGVGSVMEIVGKDRSCEENGFGNCRICYYVLSSFYILVLKCYI